LLHSDRLGSRGINFISLKVADFKGFHAGEPFGEGHPGLYLIDIKTGGFETAIAALPYGLSSALELANTPKIVGHKLAFGTQCACGLEGLLDSINNSPCIRDDG
jgi:hypothetical protein